MNITSDSLLTREYLWSPLAYISQKHLGFLVHPGSTTSAIPLSTGWHWHWPGLNVIRSTSLRNYQYIISKSVKVTASSLADETIIAATKDLRLISLEAKINLQVDSNAAIDILAKINKHSINRVIRPIIRQSLRLTIANYISHNLQPSEKLDLQAFNLLEQTLKDQGIKVTELKIERIDPYSPLAGIRK